MYADELVQDLTRDQEDLRASSRKIKLLESTLEPLKVLYDVAEAEKEELRDEVEQLEKDYEALEDKLTLDVSWAFLNTHLETLTEASKKALISKLSLLELKRLLRLLINAKFLHAWG